MIHLNKNFKISFLSFKRKFNYFGLTTVCLFFLTAGIVQAQFSGNGSGTEVDPYQITTEIQLQEMLEFLSSHFILMNDIDATATPGWNEGDGFEPVGDSLNPFSGSLNGDGFSITGLTINIGNYDFVGLIGMNSGVVKNLRIVEADITGKNYVGLIGYNSGEITNVSIEDISVTGNVYVGGLTGRNTGILEINYTTGIVTGFEFTGGMIGENNSDNLVANNYSMCIVEGTSGNVGGFVGSNNLGTLNYCYSTGAVSDNVFPGGFAGNNNGIIEECYWNITTSGQEESAGGFGMDDQLFRNQYSFTGFDFINTWSIDEGLSYPFLQNNTQIPSPGYFVPFAGGNGTVEEPYQIENSDQLQEMRNFLSSHFIIISNIDASATSGWNEGLGFLPVGTFDAPFSGVLNGGGYEITGLTINREELDYVGLIGVNAGDILNVNLSNVNITGKDNTGGLVGNNNLNKTITGSSSSGSIEGNLYVGGLVGTNDGNLNNSFSNCNVAGQIAIGGLVGENNDSIINCYATGEVTALDEASGGLTGSHNGSITNSYSSGEVSGNIDAGGLNGHSKGTVENSYWNITTSGQPSSAGGTGLAENIFRLQDSFSGFDFGDVWIIYENISYPFLSNNLQAIPPGYSNPFAGGNGTSSDPLQISDVNQLQLVNDYLNNHFVLINDIDASATSGWNSGLGFAPIADNVQETVFTGTFNGNGFVISGLTINRPEQDYVGLFSASEGEIQYLGLEDISINGHDYVGGPVGFNQGTIAMVYTTGTVTGTDNVGGITGYNDSEASISNCYSTCVVTGIGTVGGLVGENEGGEILTSYSSGLVSGNVFTGGLVGDNDGGTITQSYWNITTSGQPSSAGGTGLAESVFRMEDSFSGFDFDNAWEIYENLSYPFLITNIQTPPPGYLAPFVSGNGTSSDPFQISDVNQLQLVNDYLTNHFVLINNINASATNSWNDGEGFEPIGTNANPFTGSFDGQGHYIDELFINRTSINTGLFGSVDGGNIHNLGLTNASIKGAENSGILVGELKGNGEITQSHTTGSIESSSEKTGGLVGLLDGGTIENCYSTADVNGSSYVGGLVGASNESGTVSGSFSTGTVIGILDYVGGIKGSNLGTISVCYSSGNVSGNNNVGGLTGINDGTVTNSYSTGSVNGFESVGGLIGYNIGNVTRSYSTGNINGTDYVGGLIGFSKGESDITFSYWNITTSGQATSDGGTGLTDAQFRNQVSFSGFDFVDDWEIIEEESFPFLQNNPQDPPPGDFNRTFTSSGNLPGGTYNNVSISGALTVVTLSGDVEISGTLTLETGASLSIGANTLTLSGPVNLNGGTFVGGATSNLIIEADVVDNEFVSKAYFNSADNITGELIVDDGLEDFEVGRNVTMGSDIEISGTLRLNEGILSIGANIMTLSGSLSKTNGVIDASNSDAALAFGNEVNEIALPSGLFTGNIGNIVMVGSSGISIGEDITVSGLLEMIKGNITTGAHSLTLGTSTSNLGELLYISGSIYGKFTQWFAADEVDDVYFPVGVNLAANDYPANISFTTAPTTGGTLSAFFTPSNPGSMGLPLTDGATEIEFVSPSGYWTIEAGNGLDGGVYTLNLTASGIPGVTDFETLRILKRDDSVSPWTLNGTHATGTGSNAIPVVNRTGMSGFSQYGIGGDEDNPLSSTMTDLIIPQFIQGVNGTNDNRIPYVFLARLNGLNANATYRFINRIVETGDGDIDGVGGAIYPSTASDFVYSESPDINSSGNYSEFTTDGNGSFTGWFISVTNGDDKFTPGNDVFMRISINDGDGGTNVASRLTSSLPVRVLNWGTTSQDPLQGSIFYGNSAGSDPASPKNMLLFYDNTGGTGRPLSGSIVEGDGLNLTGNLNFVELWRVSVDQQENRWGTIIPNDNSEGVRRIEERRLNPGTIVKFITNPDGNWNFVSPTADPSNGENSGPVYDGPLEVDIANFTAVSERNNVILKWETTWEENNDRFEIKRRVYGDENASWVNAGMVRGAGSTTETTSYTFTDKNLTTGKYEYKLVQFDLNGNSTSDYELNNFVEVGVPTSFDISQNYPNPFNPVTKINYEIPVEGLVKIVVYDISGREVSTLVNEVVTPGYHTLEFNAGNFASGVYFYRLVTGNTVMTKRMVLVK